MEMRGEVRRGYFVDGLPGPQFALPEVVERLRALRDGAMEDDLVVVNACDPANLHGSGLESDQVIAASPSLSFARLPSTWQVQWKGMPVLVIRGMGSAVTTAAGTGDELAQRALGAWLAHVGKTRRRVTVKTWNGRPVLEGPGPTILGSLGFYRDYPAMSWEKR
jgi:ATP-dependent Lhr-like helicase